MDKQNISRDEIAEAMKNEFGFNRKLCLDIVNDIVEIIINGLQSDKKVKIHILILFSLIVFMKNIFAEQVTEVSDQEFFD